MSEFGPAGAAGGQWECPILTEVPVEGGARQTRWVLKVGLNPGGLQGGSGEQYFVGSFDGARFTNDNPPATTLWTDYGKDCYCALTFNGMPQKRAPGHDRLDEQLAICGQGADAALARADDRFRGGCVCEGCREGLRLTQEPVPAVQKLRGSHFTWRGTERGGPQPGAEGEGPGNRFELRSVTTGEGEWKLLEGEGKYTIVGYPERRTLCGPHAFRPH